MKKVLITLTLTVYVLCLTMMALACEGARPLAMGGAFTGLADDANATYWNPAAMGVMEQMELTYTGTVYDRDIMNYDDWVSFVVPLKAIHGKEGFDLGSIGLSFMNNIDKGKYSLLYYDININVDMEITERWYTVSYGRELGELVKGLCIGANLRYLTHEEVLRASATIGGTSYSASASSSDNLYAVDLAMYYKWQNLSVGFLYQDVNEPEFTIFGQKGKYGANFRPGAACRFFNNRVILSGEVYDAFDHINHRNFRIGGEAKITDNIAFRTGFYDFAATEKTGRAITGGIGLLSGNIFGDRKLDFSYAALYWYKSEADTKDKLTHMVSVSMKF